MKAETRVVAVEVVKSDDSRSILTAELTGLLTRMNIVWEKDEAK